MSADDEIDIVCGRFAVGDRVTRDRRIGTVVRAYSRDRRRYGDTVLGPYPELYDVQWDESADGAIPVQRCFLPHGLGRLAAAMEAKP